MSWLWEPSARRDLWMSRAYYFAFMGGVGFISPFLNLFYVSLGLSGKQIGFFSSTSAVVGLVVAPLWINEVKRRPNPRLFLQAALVITALGYLLIGQQTAFLPIVFIILFLAMAAAGVSPMSDTYAVSVAENTGKGYGSIRVWASLGWIVTVLSSGWLIGHFGYQMGFAGTGLSFIAAAGLLFLIRPQNFTTQNRGEARTSLKSAASRVFANRTLLGFAVALIFITFMNSGVLQFENVYLSQLGASKSLISVAGILSAIVELPFMLLSDRILRRYGAYRLLFLALCMNMLLRLSVLAVPSIATIMLVRFVGGTSFSVYTVSFIGLISENTSQAERGTVLALFTVTLAGLVNIVASPVSGAVFDAFGARWLYAFSALGYAVAVSTLWYVNPKRQKSTPAIA